MCSDSIDDTSGRACVRCVGVCVQRAAWGRDSEGERYRRKRVKERVEWFCSRKAGGGARRQAQADRTERRGGPVSYYTFFQTISPSHISYLFVQYCRYHNSLSLSSFRSGCGPCSERRQFELLATADWQIAFILTQMGDGRPKSNFPQERVFLLQEKLCVFKDKRPVQGRKKRGRV